MFTPLGKELSPEYKEWQNKAIKARCFFDLGGGISNCPDSIMATEPPMWVDKPNSIWELPKTDSVTQTQIPEVQTEPIPMLPEQNVEKAQKGMDTNTMLVWLMGIAAATYLVLKISKKAPA